MHMLSNHYIPSHSDLPEFAPILSPFETNDELPTTTLRGGTLLHQVSYDLLSAITTSRFLLFGWRQQPIVLKTYLSVLKWIQLCPWNLLLLFHLRSLKGSVRTWRPSPLDLCAPILQSTLLVVALTSIFSPSHLIHASDAGHAEDPLTRWGPDSLWKLGG